MTDDNSNLVDMDNLDEFENTFFNRTPVATSEPEPKEEVEEDIPENEDDALATDEDADASQEDEPEDEEEVDEEPAPKPKKKSFQDRIDELTRRSREAERREADLIRRLEAAEARKNEEVNKTDEPKPLREQLSAEAPNPDALDDDGNAVYKLGEFDPQFIRDLTKFTINEERRAAREYEEQTRQQQMIEAVQEELKGSWLEKVEAAEDELPDLREKLSGMQEAFANVEPNYGEFLAATIMSCDFGPQIMYYLSQNIGEAQKIVASGPAAATLAIGRLDARFSKPTQEEKRNTKVSSAPRPPAAITRGSVGRFAVNGDTDDLDAFEKVFFK